jgi:hypothetical protein
MEYATMMVYGRRPHRGGTARLTYALGPRLIVVGA